MSQETIRALEQTRQRLNTLATQLGALRRDLEATENLPSWPSIQNSANLLSHNLASLNATLSSSQSLLTSAHAYPLPSFPGRTQEDLLGQLLRKKLQPGVEDWIEGGVRHAASITTHLLNGNQVNGTTNGEHEGLKGGELDILWDWAGPEGNRIAREIGEDAFNDVFTLAEQEDGIENVVTGLRRKFWESDDEDEDGDEGTKGQKMDVDKDEKSKEKPAMPELVKKMHRPDIDETRSMMPLEQILKFMSTGAMPSIQNTMARPVRP